MKYRKFAAVFTVLSSFSYLAHAQESLTYISTWRAQAEHGGYYQAIAKGYYEECGLNLTIRPAGPGVNAQQLFAAGAVDIMMASHSETLFNLNQAGVPAQAVMAVFQKNPQILLTHEGNGIETLEDMRGRPVMISDAARNTYWAALRILYGFTDDQIRPYSGQIAPFLVDQSAIQQGFVTNEPFRIEQETGQRPRVFMLADHGWASYGSISIFPQRLIDTRPELVQCFVDASRRGWEEFLHEDPAPAIELIKRDNPDNPDDVIAYVIETLREEGIVEGDSTREAGIGAMSEERWKDVAEVLTGAGLLPADFDYRQVFTLQFLGQN